MRLGTEVNRSEQIKLENNNYYWCDRVISAEKEKRKNLPSPPPRFATFKSESKRATS